MMKSKHIVLLLVISTGCTNEQEKQSKSGAATGAKKRESVQLEPSPSGTTHQTPAPPIQPSSEDLAELIQTAAEHERLRNFEQALGIRRQIVALVERQFGHDSWQARSAHLSVKNAEYKARLSKDQLDLLDRIGELEQQARRSYRLGRYAEAADTYSRILQLIPKVWPARSHATAHYAIEKAKVYSGSDQSAAAAELLAFALPIQEETLGRRHPEYLATLTLLGALYQATEQFEQANSVLAQATQLTEEIWGDDHPEYATQLNNLGALWSDMKQYTSAEEVLNQSLAIRRKALGDESAACGDTLYNLGSVNLARGDVAQAGEYFRQATLAHQGAFGSSHASTIRSKNSLAACLHGQRQYAEAEVLMRDVVEARREQNGEDHPELAQALFRLGVVLRQQRKFSESQRLLTRALDIQFATLGDVHPDTVATLAAYAELLRQTGRGEQAADLETQAQSRNRRAVSGRPATSVDPRR